MNGRRQAGSSVRLARGAEPERGGAGFHLYRSDGAAALLPVRMSWGNGHEFDTCPVGIRHKENAFGLRVRSVVASFLKDHTAHSFQLRGSEFHIVDDEGKVGEP